MSQIQSALSEREFASNYLTLLSVSDSKVVLESSFRKDLREISTLGVKLPNLPNPKKSSNGLKQDKIINATFKSIKPPRFNITSKINSTTTIFEVKTDLVKNNKDLNELDPSQLKFLVKGKVIQNSALLNSIVPQDGNEITFTVMVNKDVSNSSTSTTPVPQTSTDQEPEVSSIDNIAPQTQIPWSDIAALLESKGLDSTSVIPRLQRGWELTKN